MTFDDQESALNVPATQPCKSNRDPEVVRLAEELSAPTMLSLHTCRLTSSLLLWLALLCGCMQRPETRSWITHSLTETQEKRQNELLNEIRWLISAKDDLAGKPAADFAELLSLADRTKFDGEKTIHAYDVLAGGGGDQELCEAKIVVSDGRIVSAGWPYGEF
jgi:hypothetical protein